MKFKVLSDEEKEEKLENDWDGLDQFSLITCVQEYTLRQVVNMVRRVENPYELDELKARVGHIHAIQTITQSLQQAIKGVKE